LRLGISRKISARSNEDWAVNPWQTGCRQTSVMPVGRPGLDVLSTFLPAVEAAFRPRPRLGSSSCEEVCLGLLPCSPPSSALVLPRCGVAGQTIHSPERPRSGALYRAANQCRWLRKARRRSWMLGRHHRLGGLIAVRSRSHHLSAYVVLAAGEQRSLEDSAKRSKNGAGSTSRTPWSGAASRPNLAHGAWQILQDDPYRSWSGPQTRKNGSPRRR